MRGKPSKGIFEAREILIEEVLRYKQDNPSVTATMIAKELGVKRQAVSYILANNRLPPARPVSGRPAIWDRVKRLFGRA